MTNDSSEGESSRASLGRADEGDRAHAGRAVEERGRAELIGEAVQPASRKDADVDSTAWLFKDAVGWYVELGAVCVSLASFLIYLHRGEILLFGDAVAHINIARRVFDSRYPGLLQLGTVWLPLPHLLMVPLVAVNSWWRTGAAASIPSMAAYVLSVMGIFRLSRRAMVGVGFSSTTAKLTACFAAAIYGLNPNLLYLQATAMTETLYLALFIWAVVYFSEFWWAIRGQDAESPIAPLRKCGVCLLGACLTRYDGWFAAAGISVIVILLIPRLAPGERTWGTNQPTRGAGTNRSERSPVSTIAAMHAGEASTRGSGALSGSRNLMWEVAIFLILAAIGPILWLGYNAIVYRNALEFANGPYSARAIEQRNAIPGYPPHPGSHNLVVAGAYFAKAGLFSVAEGNWQQGWLWLAVLGTAWVVWRSATLAPLLLLWLPTPFYMLSVAYGGVPIFTPTWWPFSLYNIRYGVQLLPALAVFSAIGAAFLLSMMVTNTGKRMIGVLAVAFVTVSYAGVWRAGPTIFREALVNSRTRLQQENQLAAELKKLPPDSNLLMYLGEHVGALQDAEIPLRRAISEGSHRVWVQPSDPQGLWERTLADPASYVDFVIAFEGDPVWQAVHDRHLTEVARIEVLGRRTGFILRTR